MLSQEMMKLGKVRSVIRDIFEYGKKRAAEIGAENIFDFSLGNPSIPAPPEVDLAIKELTESGNTVALHGYTSAPGDPLVRQTVANHIATKFGVPITADSIYMTAGAAASLCITLKAMVVVGDEVIAFAPFFPEYKVFAEAAGAKLVVSKPFPTDLQIDTDLFQTLVTPATKAVIINSPNNPSGVVYREDTIKKVCAILCAKSEEYGHPIYLISDEPYRELVYGDVRVPYLMNYYQNTIVCYSYSKALSLPGERIGYIAVSPQSEDAKDLFAAIAGAGRALGYVCAPALFQKVIAKCIDATSDIRAYAKNRDAIYNGLTALGYNCIKPDGAFYLFVKSPEPDAYAFCEKAKKFELLLVPGDDFGCPGYVRIAYCVNPSLIQRSMPSFANLIGLYK
ncbi:MAG: pyridoxal phosphate-dependent aminotransferase [Clostridia bacterium]|nr:pyridoxal phosphate-dependent aminotransferase [Clostridia bacterium]